MDVTHAVPAALGGDRFYGPIPVELAVFSDVGVAWGRTSRPTLSGGDRRPVSSVGAAARINLLGFAVAEIDYVRPLESSRPRMALAVQFEARVLGVSGDNGGHNEETKLTETNEEDNSSTR